MVVMLFGVCSCVQVEPKRSHSVQNIPFICIRPPSGMMYALSLFLWISAPLESFCYHNDASSQIDLKELFEKHRIIPRIN